MGRIGFRSWSWQNLAEFGGTWQNMAECRRLPLDCHQIAVRLLFRGWSLIAELVETGGRVQGVTGVSRDRFSF